ncbi:type II secretion system protein GspE [candidate division KSB3 bacterium]|uniref:Type II secretion system protein GspE n=1 Tax=candidate division KSB3 bacterium TaxID=2044937 RepID=A0A2G6E2N9_9BACT|nr:MAG: type II secretion system protein GspE [candidate division KSB3 bacterium]PIE29266.1 MAG: type II secretion system protein GspE [candidate division KSB3 bacterium]
MPKRKRLGDVLVEACIISQAQLNAALEVQKHHPQLIGQILVEMGWTTEVLVCRAVSELLNIRYVDLSSALISQEVVQLAPEALALQRNILPLFVQDKILYLAMENPLDVDIIQRMEFITGMQVKPLIAPPGQIRDIVRKHYYVDDYVDSMIGNVPREDDVSLVQQEEGEAEGMLDVSEVRKISEGSQVIRLANLIISDGIKKRASDIHLEPGSRYLNVRYRVDGLLTSGIHVPRWLQLPLVSRIKVISGLDIAERRKPQDGRIWVSFAQRKIDLRVSTLPTNFGETVVIRILDTKHSTHDLAALGMSSRSLRLYRSMLRQPQGWILVTGPTGSGKTTTLYASLHAIKDTTKNIMTVEDPIEYQLEGINQVQINPKAGLTFASGLRSILRQDPNVILLGEIRDRETAEIAMQASETGHLVLSTLHTNDAVSTVNRLFSLGISPDLVASNLLVIIAQRLVRKICLYCRKVYTPAPEELEILEHIHVETSELRFYKGQGCAACDHSGYYGQIALYEVLVQNDRIRDAIAQRPTKQALKRLGRLYGMTILLEDGLDKVRQGITTIEEVLRVCPVEPDIAHEALCCPECSAPLDNSKALCSACGYVLHISCRSCHSVLENDWTFCPYCGTQVSASADEFSQYHRAATNREASSLPSDNRQQLSSSSQARPC